MIFRTFKSKSKKIIIGLGTGRCGTVSLSKLLSAQNMTVVTHECKPILPWGFDKKAIQEKIDQVLKYSASFVGDVAFVYLSYVEWIIQYCKAEHIKVRFICLRRDKRATVESYLKKTEGRNHWCEHDGTVWMKDNQWDHAYPKYGILDKQKAIEQYYDDYYKIADDFEKKYPKVFRVFSMDALNSTEGVRKILTFSGFKEKTQNVLTDIRENSLVPQAEKRPALDKGFVIWLTGFSGAGKSTLAVKLRDYYQNMGLSVELLDGDEIRAIFPQTGFSKEERNEHIRKAGFIASLLERHGVIVIASFISPYQLARAEVRQRCQSFIEVYVNASLQECERRDTKALYKKARSGELQNFTGINDPYEIPQNPEIIVSTEGVSVQESCQHLIKNLNAIIKNKGIFI